MFAERIITVAEAATILKLSEDTVRMYLRKGRIPGTRSQIGGHWEMSVSAVRQFAKTPRPGRGRPKKIA